MLGVSCFPSSLQFLFSFLFFLGSRCGRKIREKYDRAFSVVVKIKMKLKWVIGSVCVCTHKTEKRDKKPHTDTLRYDSRYSKNTLHTEETRNSTKINGYLFHFIFSLSFGRYSVLFFFRFVYYVPTSTSCYSFAQLEYQSNFVSLSLFHSTLTCVCVCSVYAWV